MGKVSKDRLAPINAVLDLLMSGDVNHPSLAKIWRGGTGVRDGIWS